MQCLEKSRATQVSPLTGRNYHHFNESYGPITNDNMQSHQRFQQQLFMKENIMIEVDYIQQQ